MKRKIFWMAVGMILALPGLGLAGGVNVSKNFSDGELGFQAGVAPLQGQVNSGWIYFAELDYLKRYPVRKEGAIQPYGGLALTMNWGEGELTEDFEDTAAPQVAKIWGADLSYKNIFFLDTGIPISPFLSTEVGAGYGQLRHQEKQLAAIEKRSGSWDSDNAMTVHAGAGLGLEFALPQSNGWAARAEARANYINYFVSTAPATNVESTPLGFFLGMSRRME